MKGIFCITLAIFLVSILEATRNSYRQRDRPFYIPDDYGRYDNRINFIFNVHCTKLHSTNLNFLFYSKLHINYIFNSEN